jgi:hypothetical protein
MRKGKKTEESSKPKIFYSKKPSIVYRPKTPMPSEGSRMSLVAPRKDRGSSSTTLPPLLMTREDDSGGNQYGNPLNPIPNRQNRLSRSRGNTITEHMIDRMLPEWIMGVLGHANLIYICLQGHIWFTYGKDSDLYCISNDIVKGDQPVYGGTKLKHLLVRALDVKGERTYALSHISGIAMDQHSNLFILFNGRNLYIERYQVRDFAGVIPTIQQLRGGRDEEGNEFETLNLGKSYISTKTPNRLQALSIGRDNHYLFVVGYRDSQVGIISYDPHGEGDMNIVKIIEINEHVLGRHDTIHIFTGHNKSIIYVYFTNTGILTALDDLFNTMILTRAFVPDEPVIFVKWNFNNLQVFANQDGLPIIYEIDSANGQLVRTIKDPLIQSLRLERTLQPIFRFSEGPYGLYVYCRDRIVDITLSE